MLRSNPLEPTIGIIIIGTRRSCPANSAARFSSARAPCDAPETNCQVQLNTSQSRAPERAGGKSGKGSHARDEGGRRRRNLMYSARIFKFKENEL